MKLLFFMLFSAICFGQPSVVISNGTIQNIDVTIPAMDPKKFVSLTKAWVTEVQRSGEKFEVSDVNPGNLVISGYKRNAFNYRDRGETHWHDAKVVITVNYSGTNMSLKVTLPELYVSGGKVIQYTLPDYYADGDLKEGYSGLETSLKENLTRIVKSYYNFIVNYQ